MIQILDSLLPKTGSDSFVTATEEYNADKNRYPDKVPCKYIIMCTIAITDKHILHVIYVYLDDGFSRIFLRWNGEQGSDYINASYINVI